jgi:hypothetical protein
MEMKNGNRNKNKKEWHREEKNSERWLVTQEWMLYIGCNATT